MGRGALAVAVAASFAVCACGNRPSDAELDRWRAEAQAANEAEAREHGQEDERATWTLAIGGRVARPQVLAWGDVVLRFAHLHHRVRGERAPRQSSTRSSIRIVGARPGILRSTRIQVFQVREIEDVAVMARALRTVGGFAVDG